MIQKLSCTLIVCFFFEIVVADQLRINGDRLDPAVTCSRTVSDGILSVVSISSCNDLASTDFHFSDYQSFTFSAGTVVQIVCDPGFGLVEGESVSVCMPNGKWLPSLGVCKAKIFCQSPPPFIINGLIESQSKKTYHNDPEFSFEPGSWIHYRCDVGYHLKGNSKLVCSDTGEWSSRPPECQMTRDLFAAASAYWMTPRTSSKFEACEGNSAANVVLADPMAPDQGIVVCWSGEIIAIKADCNTIVWRARLKFPNKVHGGIWYAAVDSVSMKIFFTFAANTGILWTSLLELARNKKESTPLRYFVDGKNESFQKRSYYGLAIDSEKQLLYCCDPYDDQSIGVWSMRTGTLLGKIARPSLVRVFQPSNIALSPVQSTAGYQMIAVADWNNDLVHLFKAYITSDGKPFISFSGTIANGTMDTTGEDAALGFVTGPSGLFFDAANNLMVADNLNTRLQVFVPEFGRGKLPHYEPSWVFSEFDSGAASVVAIVNEDDGNYPVKNNPISIPRPVLMIAVESGHITCLK